MAETMKVVPDDENEVQDVLNFKDQGWCRATPVARLAPDVALAVVSTLMAVVRRGHASPAATQPNELGIVRSQVFEEGYVYMLEAPFEGYFADRYLMDFYAVRERRICSRLH